MHGAISAGKEGGIPCMRRRGARVGGLDDGEELSEGRNDAEENKVRATNEELDVSL
jgi:hypothetical protein